MSVFEPRPRDPASVEYYSWFGYAPTEVCPNCGTPWTDVMFAYDGPHCQSPMSIMWHAQQKKER